MSKKNNVPKLVLISEAAEILGVSIDTARRWDKKGILHSKRVDGKNRYFSIDELEKIKLSRPLSISEVAEKLKISATTLRRLEKKGLIKPERNNNGERLYNLDSLREFLHNQYFLRQKTVEEQIFQPLKGVASAAPTTSEEALEHKIIGEMALDSKEHISRIERFQKALIFSGLFIAISSVLLVVLLTIAFIFFPNQISTLLGYANKTNITQSYLPQGHFGNVLGASTQKNPQIKATGILGFLKPFAKVSLGIVKAVDNKKYQQVAPNEPVQDVSEVLQLNASGVLETKQPLRLPDSSYIQIGDQSLMEFVKAQLTSSSQTSVNESTASGVVLQPDGTITGLKITTANLPTNLGIAVSAGSITTLQLADGAVTAAKLGSDISLTPSAASITSAMLKDAAIITATIADGSITAVKINDGAVTSGKISDGTILNADVSDSAAISDGKLAQITTADKVNGSAVQLSSTGGLRNNSGLSLKACNTDETLVWNGSTWACTATSSFGGGGAGTITSVSAGTGLTGGGSSGAVTLAVNAGTGANQIVQLNSSSELPAVSGVNLTNISAANIASGTVALARLANITTTELASNAGITNAQLAGSIAYSKLSLTGAILNADLAGSIAYNKLSLTGSILNADLAGSIAYNKLSLTGSISNTDLAGSIASSKLVGTDITTVGALSSGSIGSGFGNITIGGTVNAGSITTISSLNTAGTYKIGGTDVLGANTLGTGVTSSSLKSLGTITTGVWNGTAITYSNLNLTGSILNADLAGSIAYSKLSLSGSILNSDLAGSIAYNKLSLTGAILNADLAGSITSSKLVGTDITTVGALTSGSIASGFGNITTGGTVNAGSVTVTGTVNSSSNYSIAGTQVLGANTLGTGVTSSSLKSLGTITSGVWNGTAITYSNLNLTGAILNADLAGSIAYNKLSLAGAILNADLAGSIAYNKLSLTGSILNADLVGSIAASKLVGTDITTVGALNSGSISSGFGNINIGGSSFTGGTLSLGTGSTAALTFTGANAGILFGSTLSTISTGGTASLALMPGGKVGIGTTNPTAKLDVLGNVMITNAASLGTATSATQITTGDANTKGFIIKGTNATSYSATVLADSPQSYWRFGESSGTTALDSSGNGHTAAYGSVTLGTTGGLTNDSDTAVTLAGNTSSFITLPTYATSTTVTMEAWIYPTGVAGADHYASILTDTSGAFGLFYVNTDDKIDMYFSADHKNNTALTRNAWNHIVISINAGNGTFYLNGVADGTFSSFPGYNITRAGLAQNASEFFGGRFDEFSLYSTALSSGRVLAHYNAGRAIGTSQVANLQEFQSGTGSLLAVFDGSGRLGLGTSAPNSVLSIAGGISIGTTSSSSVFTNKLAPDGGLLVEGKVGIGMTSPSNALDINGSVSIDGAGGVGVLPQTSMLYISGNTGLGTTNPSYKLDVNGTVGIGATGNALNLSGIGSNINFSGAGLAQILTASSQNLALMPGGNVGIGTTAPTSKLAVAGGLSIGTTSTSSTFTNKLAPSGGAIFEGNVGIGTTNPGAKLDVSGNVTITNAIAAGTPSSATQITTGDPNTKGLIIKGSSNSPTWTAVVQADSPLLWWRLGESSGLTATDSSGNGYTGAYSATGVAYSQAGAFINDANTAISLTAVSSGFVTIADNNAFHVTTGSLECTFKTSTTGVLHICGNENINSDINGYAFFLINGRVNFELAGASSFQGFQSTPTYNDGAYHYVVATWDGGHITVYIDGSQVSQVVQTVTPAWNSYPFNVGKSSNGASFFFNGTVDDVAIYSTVLSAARVTAHYNAATTIGTVQASNLQEFQSYTGTVLSVFDKNGLLAINTGSTAVNYTFDVGSYTSSSRGINLSQSGSKLANDYAAYFANTSTSSTSSVNKYGLYLASTGTWNGTSSNNYGLFVDTPTGGTNNYAAIFNGLVGIGTTAPTSKLAVAGGLSIGTTSSSSVFTNKLAPDGGLLVEGKVGIGMTSPSNALDINGSVSIDGVGGVGVLPQTSQLYVAGNTGLGTTAPTSKLAVAGGLSIGTTSTSSTFTNALAPSGGLIVEGNVGIGKSSPTSKLDVLGNATFTNSITAGTAASATQINTGDANTKGLIIKGNTNATSYSSTVLADSPRAYWRLGESSGSTATDSSGNGNTASYNTVTLGTSALVQNDQDTAVTLAGGNTNFVTLPSFTSGTTYTIEAWVHPTSSTAYQSLVTDATGSNGLFYRGDVRKFSLFYGIDHLSTTVITNDTTHHIVVSVSAGSVTFYLDGVADGTYAGATSFTMARTGHDSANENFTGVVDELAIYTTALSSGRASAHYTVGSTAGTSQTSNLQEFQSYTGTIYTVFDGTGRLGLGTTAPTSKLSIAGGISVGTTSPSSTFTNKLAPDGGAIFEGNVGIGTTNPGYILDVQHASSKINSKNGYLTNGADYAEWFPSSDTTIKEGEVVSLDSSGKITRSAKENDTKVIGIISTNPGYVGNNPFHSMDEEMANKETGLYKLVGLVGQVPTFISTENGPIEVGDLLTTSMTPGVAVKAIKAGQIIGKAQENYSGTGIGKIMTYVNITYADPNGILAQLITDTSVGLSDTATSSAGLVLTVNKVIADTIQVQNITVDKDSNLNVNLDDAGQFVIKDKEGNTKISFDNKGNATFAGLVIADTIKANHIEGLSILTDQIATLSAGFTNLQAHESSQSAVLGANTSQKSITFDSGSFNTLQISGGLTVGGPVEFQGFTKFLVDTFFQGDVYFEGRAIFNRDAGGFARIKKGDRSVAVVFDHPYPQDPTVNITMTSNTMDQEKFNQQVSDGLCSAGDELQICERKISAAIFNKNVQYRVISKSRNGFVIYIDQDAPESLDFSWSALGIKNPRYSESLSETTILTSPTQSPIPTLTIAPTQVATPTSSPIPSPTIDISPTTVASQEAH